MDTVSKEHITLHCGDVLAVLPALPSGSVGAVITDPPYSSGAATLSGKQADPATKYQNSGTRRSYPPMLGDGRDQRSFTTWAAMWLSECWRIARDGAPLVVFSDWRQLPAMTDAVQAAGWHWRGIVVWYKRSARPMRGEFRRDTEFVIYARKGAFTRHSDACLPGVYDCPVNAAQKVHLTGKPVELMRQLLEIVPPGATVLDPFMGGGSTGMAGLQTGHPFVGVELSQEYAKLSCERLKVTCSASASGGQAA